MALTVSFAGRVSSRFGRPLLLVPREYRGMLSSLKGRRVRVWIGDLVFEGRIVEYQGYLYVRLPKAAFALHDRRYYVIRLEVG